jgi:hypothetical protein
MVKKPVMYDAWRHSLFLLLPVAVLATRGWVFVFEKLTPHIKWLKIWLFGTGFALVGGVVGIFIPDLFAFLSKEDDRAQNKTELYLESDQTHFNRLGQKLIKRYPMQIDYWHQTNYQALEWVGKQLPADASALVIGKGESLMLNAMLLPSALQWRIHTVTPEFLDSTVTLASINAIWPEVNAKLKAGHTPMMPIKQVYWIDFGDRLQLKEPLEFPTMQGVVTWELAQSFYREKLPLLRIYRAVLKPTK